MTAQDFLSVLRRNWQIILAVALVATAIGATLVLTSPKIYSAQTTLYISAQSPGDNTTSIYQGSLLSEQRTKSYVALVGTDRVSQQVKDALNLPESVDQIASSVSASSVPDTVLISISVRDQDPGRAARIANTFGDVFSATVSELERPVGINQASTISARVFQPAEIPTTPISPRPTRDVGLAFAFGLMLGVVVALMRNAFDRSIRSAEQLRSLVQAPSLGEVPSDDAFPSSNLAELHKPGSQTAEALRRVRTNLQYVDVDQQRKCLVITSSVPAEGKSTLAANLAISIGLTDLSVCVVDADLRRPTLAGIFGLESAVGLSTILSRRCTLEDAVQTWRAGVVDVIASGEVPPNPSELLSSRQMADLIKQLRARYDVVLFDVPPLLAVADAAALAASTDGAILVCRLDRVGTAEVGLAAGALDAVSAKTVGTVTNMSSQKADSYTTKYGSYVSAGPRNTDHVPAPIGLDDASTENLDGLRKSHPSRPTPQRRSS